MTSTSPVLKQIADLPKLSHAELKALWREYFGVEPPAYRRGFLIRGLAHRLQELTYGGLKPAYQARLDAMIAGTEKPNGGGRPGGARARTSTCSKHEAAPRLARRDPRGHRHRRRLRAPGPALPEPVGGRRAITGTQWSGRCSSACKTGGGMSRPKAQDPLRDLHPQVQRGGPGAGLQQPRRPARGRRAYIASQKHEGWVALTTATTMAASPAARWSARHCSG